eukprot:403366200
MESLQPSHGNSNQPHYTQFIEGEHVDVYDSKQIRWYNAEIVHVDMQNKRVQVHYSGLGSNYDEFIELNSPRIQKQWRDGMEFKINNRLDILDKDFRWLEATIVEITSSSKKIKVHFRGFSSQHDEWIDCVKERNRILEVGSLSNGFGWAKFSQKRKQELEPIRRQTEELRKHSLKNVNPVNQNGGWGIQAPVPQAIDWRLQEANFAKALYTKRLRIIETGRDGNCLFRAIAYQAYGDEDEHRLVRQKCMDYILSEKEYFKDFIIGGNDSSVEAYVNRKRVNAVWGDDVEIQAMSEIYNRPIEIYAYSAEPMRTFHEQDGSNEPIRLSYHGKSHYNSIVRMDWTYEKVFVKTKAGEIEDEAIKLSKLREEKTNEVQNQNNVQKKIDDQSARLMSQIIMRSREDFHIQSKCDMQQALLQTIKDINATKRNIEDENLEKALKESQMAVSEDEILQQVLKQSLEEQNQAQKRNQDLLKGINYDDALLQTLQALNINNPQPNQILFNINQPHLITAGCQYAMENGFSMEQGMEAVRNVGDNPEMVMSYLFEKYCM